MEQAAIQLAILGKAVEKEYRYMLSLPKDHQFNPKAETYRTTHPTPHAEKWYRILKEALKANGIKVVEEDPLKHDSSATTDDGFYMGLTKRDSKTNTYTIFVLPMEPYMMLATLLHEAGHVIISRKKLVPNRSAFDELFQNIPFEDQELTQHEMIAESAAWLTAKRLGWDLTERAAFYNALGNLMPAFMKRAEGKIITVADQLTEWMQPALAAAA